MGGRENNVYFTLEAQGLPGCVKYTRMTEKLAQHVLMITKALSNTKPKRGRLLKMLKTTLYVIT